MSRDDLFGVEIIFKGEVQGVGFRAKTARLGQELGVKGTVCNLPDGSVKVVAQGSEKAINSLVASLRLKFNISEVLLSDNFLPVIIYDAFIVVK